jgi:hypothetical protein
MADKSEEEGFTVVDKRGRRTEPAAEPSPPGPSSTRPTPSGLAAESAYVSYQEPDLTALFLMLASSALVHMGKSPDPVTGAAQRDLAQAKLAIDLLRLLRDKTEGHRTAEESQILEQILSDLQMEFVHTVGGPG